MSRGPHRRPQPQPVRPVNQITDLSQLPLICTATDASRLLRCTPELIHKKARQGELPGFKVSGSNAWLFRRDDLFSYIENMILRGGKPA